MLDQNADISFFYEIKFETELINRNNNFAKERSSVQIRIKRVNSKVGVYLTDGSPKANIRRRSSHSFIAITFLHEGSRRGKKKKKEEKFRTARVKSNYDRISSDDIACVSPENF